MNCFKKMFLIVVKAINTLFQTHSMPAERCFCMIFQHNKWSKLMTGRLALNFCLILSFLFKSPSLLLQFSCQYISVHGLLVTCQVTLAQAALCSQYSTFMQGERVQFFIIPLYYSPPESFLALYSRYSSRYSADIQVSWTHIKRVQGVNCTWACGQKETKGEEQEVA